MIIYLYMNVHCVVLYDMNVHWRNGPEVCVSGGLYVKSEMEKKQVGAPTKFRS